MVDDRVITLREVQRAAVPALSALQRFKDPERRRAEEQTIYRQALDDLIGQTLVLKEARKLKLEATAVEVDGWLDNLKRQYGWSDEEMREAIRSQGTTMVRYREDVRRRIVTNRVVQVKLGSSVRVSDEDVEDTFQREYAGKLEEPELTVRHVLFVVPDGAAQEEEAEKAERAGEARRRLQAGEDFGQVARELSEGPSASKGGELGSFSPGSLDPDFESAALGAEVGEIVGPVRTRFGWHVLQVTRRRAVRTRDPAQLKAEIRARLRQEGLQRQLKLWIDELKRAAFVDVRL